MTDKLSTPLDAVEALRESASGISDHTWDKLVELVEVILDRWAADVQGLTRVRNRLSMFPPPDPEHWVRHGEETLIDCADCVLDALRAAARDQ